MTPVAERTALDAAHEVVEALGDGVAAAYVIGSVSYGGFEPGRSDLDLVAVWDGPLARGEKEALVERVRALDFAPARGLELVVYAEGERALNVNTGPGMEEHVGYEPADDPGFWFVLDRAVAQEHALALVGPPWGDVFPRVSRDETLAALEESLRWHEANEPRSANTLLNALRAWRYAETGDLVSKPAATEWLLERVRAALREAR